MASAFPRITALALGVAILAWQGLNARNGAFLHRFLVADLAVAALLILGAAWGDPKRSAVALLVAFSATAGVFLAATTGALLADGYSPGRLLTGLGLVPCATCLVALGRRLARTP